VTRVRALNRKLLFDYLSQAYNLYLRILGSQDPELVFHDLRSALRTKFNIKTHDDLPRASILLKLVFDGTTSKTINLYTRAFQYAAGYEINPADFEEFIKASGGLEKIRKTYATILAVDKGDYRPAYVKNAEDSASMNLMSALKNKFKVQLTESEASILRNDILGRFCLVFASIDSLNQLEVYGQFASDKQLVNRIIEKFTSVEKGKQNSEWQDQKRQIGLHNAKTLQKQLTVKENLLLEKAESEKKVVSASSKKASQKPSKSSKVISNKSAGNASSKKR
jgi:hypothetical protein